MLLFLTGIKSVLGRAHLEDSVLEAFQTPKMRVAKVSQVLKPVTEDFVTGTSWSRTKRQNLRRRCFFFPALPSEYETLSVNNWKFEKN